MTSATMDTDLFLTVGIVLLILSLPPLLSAWVEGRAPRVGAVMVTVGATMVVAALIVRPGGYGFGDIPDVIVGVLSRWYH
jgi:formate-dependent nitrite reductase membrane component NrfD